MTRPAVTDGWAYTSPHGAARMHHFGPDAERSDCRKWERAVVVRLHPDPPADQRCAACQRTITPKEAMTTEPTIPDGYTAIGYCLIHRGREVATRIGPDAFADVSAERDRWFGPEPYAAVHIAPIVIPA